MIGHGLTLISWLVPENVADIYSHVNAHSIVCLTSLGDLVDDEVDAGDMDIQLHVYFIYIIHIRRSGV